MNIKLKLLAVFLLSGICAAQAQYVRYSTSIPSISSGSSVPYLIANTPPNSPVLAVCNSPANQLPCTNYATTYTSLGVACSNGAQDTPDPQPSSCQSTGDALGNIGFWVKPGTYDYTVCVGSTNCFGPYTITLGVTQPNNVSNLVNSGVFTNTQPNLYNYSQVGSIGSSTVFGSFGFPYETDAFTGITTLPVGATVHQGNGVAGFGFTDATSSPLGTTANAVGGFFVGEALVSNSAAWGTNSGCSVANSTTGTLCVGNEIDMGAGTNTSPTRFQGLFITGSPWPSTFTPPAGPVMGTLNVASNSGSYIGIAFSGTTGTNPQFPVGIWSARGTAPIGLMLDAACYTGACNSQSIQQGSSNGSTIFTYSQTLNQKGEETLSTTGTGVGIIPPSAIFSALSSSATNGSYLFCSDCTNTADDAHVAGQSCAGSGHGAMAMRQNGAWRCY